MRAVAAGMPEESEEAIAAKHPRYHELKSKYGDAVGATTTEVRGTFGRRRQRWRYLDGVAEPFRRSLFGIHAVGVYCYSVLSVFDAGARCERAGGCGCLLSHAEKGGSIAYVASQPQGECAGTQAGGSLENALVELTLTCVAGSKGASMGSHVKVRREHGGPRQGEESSSSFGQSHIRKRIRGEDRHPGAVASRVIKKREVRRV